MQIGRFAPSTTGPAHPGTLLAALLCWLDARSLSAQLLLRLEDLDPERCRPEWTEAMLRDLAWLGLDFDRVEVQSDAGARHHDALDRLAAQGRLYPCRCSRSLLRNTAVPAPDGGLRYPGTCRERALPEGGWRESGDPLRARLPTGPIEIGDESGDHLSQDPAAEMGDPVVRRRDGQVAYQLAGVVDDAHAGVTRIVRGRDLAASTATQVALQQLLELPRPIYRHHLLLLEQQGGGKLAKLHGAVDIGVLREHYDAEALCGVLAHAAGLAPSMQPTTPTALLEGFDWNRVAVPDRVMHWNRERLEAAPATPATRSS